MINIKSTAIKKILGFTLLVLVRDEHPSQISPTAAKATSCSQVFSDYTGIANLEL